MKPPPRPWYLRPYIFPLLIFVPGIGGGAALRLATNWEWLPLLTSIVLITLCGNIMVNKWHAYCARYGHRSDL